jgi:hypothetical protein
MPQEETTRHQDTRVESKALLRLYGHIALELIQL